MLKNIFLSFLLLGIVLFSCEKEKADSTSPSITITSPEDGDEFEPGSIIPFNAVFNDNVGLGSYKVEIHINDDGHTHSRVLDTGEPFNYLETETFANGKKEETVNLQIQIPANAEHGEYHVGVYCTDASGNEVTRFVEIHIEDLL